MASTISNPNWKDLLPELLANILKFLPIADNVRFGAVCTDWYTAAANSPHPPAPQPPFLLFAGGNTGDNDTFQFLDLSVKKLYSMPIPQLRDRWCIGSSDGKLIYSDDHLQLHVLDPITGSHFDLPSVTTFPDHPVLGTDGNTYPNYKRADGKTHYYRKVIICPRTSAVVVLRTFTTQLAFCLPGDTTWTVIDPATHTHAMQARISLFEVAFYKECIYGASYRGLFVSYKIDHDFKDTEKFKLLTPLPREHTSYLVEVDGELLHVCVYAAVMYAQDTDGEGGIWPNRITQEIQLDKMNWGTMQWEEIKSIGEYALFLGFKTAFSLSTKGNPELRANSIYLTYLSSNTHVVDRPHLKCDLAVVNLEDGTIEPCYSSENNLYPNCPPPFWFTPKVISNFV